MNPSLPNIQNLLNSVKRISAHQAEIQRLKGENFNLFSILGMESAENKTHSAFLGEMLSPRGSHGFGQLFLEKFLQSIEYSGPLDIRSAQVILEKYIGPRDDENKTGGRIDIYLEDNAGNSISIENKIYASDQYAQIERYVKHKKAHPNQDNTVYYLTLEGNEASEASRGELISEQDYHCISYKTSIIEWLKACMKEAAEMPILRESIKQYIVLIQKLTNQLSDTKMENELRRILEANYTEAKLIRDHLGEVEESRAMAFLRLIHQELVEMFKDDSNWSVSISPDLSANHASIDISHCNWNGIKVILKGYKLLMRDPWFLGIIAWDQDFDREDFNKRIATALKNSDKFKGNEWGYFKEFESPNMKNGKDRLFDANFFDTRSTEIAEEMRDFAEACEIPLAGIQRLAK